MPFVDMAAKQCERESDHLTAISHLLSSGHERTVDDVVQAVVEGLLECPHVGGFCILCWFATEDAPFLVCEQQPLLLVEGPGLAVLQMFSAGVPLVTASVILDSRGKRRLMRIDCRVGRHKVPFTDLSRQASRSSYCKIICLHAQSAALHIRYALDFMVAWIRLRFVDDDSIGILRDLRPFALQADVVDPRGLLVIPP